MQNAVVLAIAAQCLDTVPITSCSVIPTDQQAKYILLEI